jgi:hypothetical protein
VGYYIVGDSMIEREGDPIVGLINGLGIAFLFWAALFLLVQIIRAVI